jgi:sec-independent protein translocase protein TatA
MLGSLGPFEIVVILLIVVLLFGGKKLGPLGKSLGEGIRNFKDSLKGKSDSEGPKNPEPPAS